MSATFPEEGGKGAVFFLPCQRMISTEHYIDRLKENNIPVERVLLFGSYTKGAPREDSDIDCCDFNGL